MKRTACLPRNFFKRPKIKRLVPDTRLLIAVLSISCESHVGVYIPSGESEDTGLNWDSIRAGKRELIEQDLIEVDVTTGEIFIKDFFRDNKFVGAQRIGQAQSDFGAIESISLRQSVLDAIKNSPECGLNDKNIVKISSFVNNQSLSNQDKDEAKDEVEVEESSSSLSAAEDFLKNENQKQDQKQFAAKNNNQTVDDDNDILRDEYLEFIACGVLPPKNDRDYLNFAAIKAIATVYQVVDAVKSVNAELGRKPFSSAVLKELKANAGGNSAGRPKVARHLEPESFEAESLKKSNERFLEQVARHGGNVVII